MQNAKCKMQNAKGRRATGVLQFAFCALHFAFLQQFRAAPSPGAVAASPCKLCVYDYVGTIRTAGLTGLRLSAMRILQLTSSLPLSPTGSSAPFILHIGRALAARGHDVHLVAPYHPDLQWGEQEGNLPEGNLPEGNLHLHFFKYAPFRGWHIWGYGQSLQSDVRLKPGVFFLLPLVAVSAARRLRRGSS